MLDRDTPVLFDVAAHTETIIDNTLFPNAYNMTRIEWRHDGCAFTFEYNQRGHQIYRVIEVYAKTGKARAIIDEEMPTFSAYSGTELRHDIQDGRESIWMSERHGRNHLYRYDGTRWQAK